MAQTVKNLPAIQQTWVQSLGGRSPGEGHGNPLQYSCLANSMDRGAWQVAVTGLQRVGHDWSTKHGIANSLNWVVVTYVCSLWDKLLSCTLRIGILFFMNGILQLKYWKKKKKRLIAKHNETHNHSDQATYQPRIRQQFSAKVSHMVHRHGVWHQIWLGPQLGLSPRIPTSSLSMWSGVPHSIVAKFQSRKWGRITLWPSLRSQVTSSVTSTASYLWEVNTVRQACIQKEWNWILPQVGGASESLWICFKNHHSPVMTTDYFHFMPNISTSLIYKNSTRLRLKVQSFVI